MKSFSLNLSMTFVVAALAAGVLAAPLAPGSKAPKIEVKEWVKGKPVPGFSADGVYVVEFWATWCGPCVESIPHITSLSKQFPQVTFSGISLYEENADKRVQKFVDKMGDKMDYNVAWGGNREGMAKTWLDAAKQDGIPTAFIVSKRQIMWIGHPDNLEEPLKAVLAGSYDVKSAREKFIQETDARTYSKELRTEAQEIEFSYYMGKVDEAKKRIAVFQKKPGAERYTKDILFKWGAYENPAKFKEELLVRLKESEMVHFDMGYFATILAEKEPRLALWVIRQLLQGYKGQEPYWMVRYSAAQVMRTLKEWDKALEFANRAKAEALAEDPEGTKGNAVQVISKFIKEVEEAKTKG